MNKFLQAFFYQHIGCTIGIGLFTVSLFTYRSYESKQVFGLWSYPFLFIIILSVFLFLTAIIRTLLAHKKKLNINISIRSPLVYIELAILLWGSAYFINSVNFYKNAALIADLNLFGFFVSSAIVIGWLALVFLIVGVIIFLSVKYHGKLTNAILFTATICIIFLIIEGALRIRAIMAPIPQGFPTYTTALWGNRYVKINSKGFRDVEHSNMKEAGVRRLLIVGDSVAFGWGIKDINDRLSEQIAEKLTLETNSTWEVINASRVDTHTLHHIDFLKEYTIFNPDIIILLYVFNDIDYLKMLTPRDSYKALNSRYNFFGILYRNFYSFQELFIRLRLIGYSYGEDVQIVNSDPYEDNMLVNRHLEDVMRFVELASENGGLVRVIPFDISVIADSVHRKRYENFVNLAISNGIPVWNLKDIFEDYMMAQLRVNKFDGHPNELANALAAKEIVKRIITELQLNFAKVENTVVPRCPRVKL